MPGKTPVQIVKEKFGSKKELAKLLYGKLDRPFEEESAEDFERRVRTTSNKKLLHLYEVHSELERDFGTKEKLVDAIMALRHGDKKPDLQYRTKLMSFRPARLLAMHRSLKKKAPVA